MRILILLAAAGCSSTVSGGMTSGQVPGGGFDTSDTISATISTSDGAGGSVGSARIVIASTAQLCSDAAASPPIDRKNQRTIAIELADVSGATRTAPTAAGTYTIYPDTGSEPPKSASLFVTGLDSTCQPLDADTAQAQSGTVTLTSVTGGVFAGSFSVVLNTGGSITGSFDPEACPALQTAAASDTQHSCL